MLPGEYIQILDDWRRQVEKDQGEDSEDEDESDDDYDDAITDDQPIKVPPSILDKMSRLNDLPLHRKFCICYLSL